MKYAAMLMVSGLLITACKKGTDITETGQVKLAQKACGSEMRWLQNMIAKGEEDRKTRKYLGAYMGTIFLSKYQGRPVFVVTMMLNSGGLMYHSFDCDSQRVVIPDPHFYEDTKARGEVVYANSP